jgi:hypothetical protein
VPDEPLAPRDEPLDEPPNDPLVPEDPELSPRDEPAELPLMSPFDEEPPDALRPLPCEPDDDPALPPSLSEPELLDEE